MSINNVIKLSVLSVVASSALYAADANNAKEKLEGVTVTANKVEENIQDVPQSITVLSGEILEEKGTKGVMDIISQIPNMHSSEMTGTMINFRGLNQSIFTQNNPVVMYVDGVPVADRTSFNLSMVNIERIEVLRGPQGTLYGKDAIGAVINVITKDPKNVTTGEVGLEYSSYNTQRATVSVSTPVVDDKLYVTVNGEIDKTDGWVTNTKTDDDKAGASEDKKFGVALKYKASDKLTAKLDIKTIDTEDNYAYATGSRETDLNKVKRELREKISIETDNYEKFDIDTQSLNLKYDTDALSINSITTRKTTHTDGLYDGDFISDNPMYPDSDGLYQWMDQEREEMTQELRVSNNAKEGMKWVAGAYFDKEEVIHNRYGWQFANYDPTTYAPTGGASYQDAPSTSNSQTQALFGQTMIPVNDKLEVTLGARAQKIKKDIDFEMYYLPVGTATTGQTPMSKFKAEKTWNAFLPKLAATYKLNDNLNTYVSISKGYMPGGFNFFSSSGKAESFEPQTSTNYEAGIKGSGDNITFSASVFRMNITDIHIYKIEQGGMMYLTDNAKEAHSQGIEFDFTYFPTDTLEISGALGFIDAEYDDYDAGDGKNLKGERIENTPTHNASFSVAYYAPKGYYARTDVKNAGEVEFFDASAKTMRKANGFTSANVKAGYRFDSWDLYGFVTNITNEEHIQSYQNNPSVGGLATFSEPRKIGFGAKYKF